jgi:hypothetical protein
LLNFGANAVALEAAIFVGALPRSTFPAFANLAKQINSKAQIAEECTAFAGAGSTKVF